jgi:hypothetical protein
MFFPEGRIRVFPYFESRRHEHVQQAPGLEQVAGAVLHSDGYEAYARYAEKTGITHAQCRVHCRRGFFEAQRAEPRDAAEALEQIKALYEIEQHIRDQKLGKEAKRLHRLTHSKPLVDKFFDWVEHKFEQQGLLPSNALTKALAYARERRAGLQVFLTDPDVPMVTNHLERTLRVIPMTQELAVLLVRGGRAACGHRAKPDRHAQAARHRPVHLPGGRAATRGPAPGSTRGRTHPAVVEAALRRHAAALGIARSGGLDKDAGRLPLTAVQRQLAHELRRHAAHWRVTVDLDPNLHPIPSDALAERRVHEVGFGVVVAVIQAVFRACGRDLPRTSPWPWLPVASYPQESSSRPSVRSMYRGSWP